jgi:hypothetical protein
MSEHSDDIVRLAKAFNPVQAHIWEQALTAEGIHCKVVGDYLDAGLGDVPGIRAEIWVHQKDAERARQVLEKHSSDVMVQGDAPDDPKA